MKKIFLLSMLVPFIMICSCQKKDSNADQQLGQRRVEVEAHEQALVERMNALDERVNALDDRVKALAEKGRATANAPRTNPTDTQGRAPDPAEVQAQREWMIQQFSVGRPDPVAAKAEKDEAERKVQEQRAQSQPELGELQRARQSKDAMGMSGGAIFPAPAATLPIPSPAEEATSPNSSQPPE